MERKNYRKIIADKIIKFRKSHSLSQEAFADAVGLHRTYIGSIERCERNLTLSSLETLANYMNIDLPILLSEEGDNNE